MSTGPIVLSGATGFVGRHLANSLLADGYHLLVLVRAASNLSKIPRLPQVAIVDVADLDSEDVRSRLRRCAAWINAATAYGRGDSSDAALVESANIHYPLRILDEVVKAGCKTVIHFDSFFTKEELVHDYLPVYTAAKKEFVKRARLRIADTSTSLFNLRLEHVYGPLDDQKKFVPWLFGQLLRNTPRIPLTTGLQERDFVFVDDVVDAVRTVLGRAPATPGDLTTIPLGTGIRTSIRSLATIAKKICNSSSELDFGAIPLSGRGIESSAADTEFLHALGWRSKVSLAEGIERTFIDLRTRSGHYQMSSAGR